MAAEAGIDDGVLQADARGFVGHGVEVRELAVELRVEDRIAAGQAQVDLDSLAPDSAASVSLIFGTWNGSACQLVLVNDNATTGTTLIGNASAGSFCVRVSDIGKLTGPTTYTITVTHF